ncbi:MAG: VWA domain-containing protein, partial [Acidimicrobiales bacterium]
WEGGTRIGDSVRTFVRDWGRRGLARGAVVVICSDGLERGDPDALAAEMAKLARLAHRIVWVNPLKGDPRYQPLARGMSAALPYVDVFLSGHDLASLEVLAALLPDLM